jgi:hypothetical protein
MAAYYLCIEGRVAGYAVGEAQQQGQMTYGDVLESAKSNALTRLCKGMGISLELWSPAFVGAWKAKYAVQDVPNPKRNGELLWRRVEPVVANLVVSVGPSMAGYDKVPVRPPVVFREEQKPKTADDIVKEVVKALSPEGASAIAPVILPTIAPPPPPDIVAKAALSVLADQIRVSADRNTEAIPGSTLHSVIVKVSNVNVHKPGPQSRQKNPSYRIVDTEGKTYYTFDKTLAVIAKESSKSGVSVKIGYNATNYGYKIETLVSGPFDEQLPLGEKK